MNVPVNYDDELERKKTDPRLLPKAQPVGGLSETDKRVLSTALKKMLGDARRDNQGGATNSVSQQPRKPTSAPQPHRRSVLDKDLMTKWFKV